MKINASILALVVCFHFAVITDQGHAAEGTEKFLIQLGDQELKAEIVIDSEAATLSVRVLDKTGNHAVKTDRDFIYINTIQQGKPRQYRLPAIPNQRTPQSAFTIQHRVLINQLTRHQRTSVVRFFVNGRGYSGIILDPQSENHHGHEH